jgi:hypothetical protein
MTKAEVGVDSKVGEYLVRDHRDHHRVTHMVEWDKEVDARL